jgi:diguanylate cyclase (GGDEF)-like protein
MQISIFKVFANIRSLFALMLLLVILLTLTILSEYSSFQKLENLQKQKEHAAAIINIRAESTDLSTVQFRGKSAMLKNSVESLKNFYQYDYLSQAVSSGSYWNEINKLSNAIDGFNKAANRLYTGEALSEEEYQTRRTRLLHKYTLLVKQIDTIIAANMPFEQQRFYLQQAIAFALLALILFGFLWLLVRLTQIKSDIKTLSTLSSQDHVKFRTVEADTIAKLFGRAPNPSISQNPAYLDSVSGINNYKGFIHEYTATKSKKLGNYTAVCVFSIDKLNEIESTYSKQFAETIIKKVSFILSLHREHNDMIARLNHNQFIIMISRQDKAAALKTCEHIRKNMAETIFTAPDGQQVKASLSGGFVQKLSTHSIEEIIDKANKVLSMSIKHGGNRIAQLRDEPTTMR